MKKIQLIAVLFIAFLTSCADSSSNTNIARSNTATIQVSESEDTIASKGRLPPGGGGGGGKMENSPLVQQVSLNQAEQTQTAPTAIERKIIRNAELQLEATSPEESQQKITQIAKNAGGFVVESTQSGSDVKATTRDVVAMTVRVPANKFDETFAEIRKTGTRIISETVKGQDVTEEFIDIEARLKTQKALEAQFVEIMKQAKTVEDALNVQRELAEVRGEIEKLEGRKRFLENQASLSTIKIRLQTPAAVSAGSTGFFYRLTESLSDGFNAALNFLLGLITFVIAILPFLLFIVLPIYLVLRYFWKKSRKQKTASEIFKDEVKNES
ncbi:MAG: DUF4349 domain-containing protein [Acidobacteriota bacterium]|nr:DUF4349 domain-containing protein [Acidobacteriota bacterium]